MVEANVGRLIVVDPRIPMKMLGIITRGDLLAAHAKRLRSARHASRHFRFRESRQ
jgi:CBS domain-containing protein